MQEGKSVIRFKSGAPPLEVNNNMLLKSTRSTEGTFKDERFITYTFGKRVLCLNISEIGSGGRVNVVDINLWEKNGKDSFAKLNMRFIRNDWYGVLLYNTKNSFEGSYKFVKENYYGVPPMADTEVIEYRCSEIGLGGSLTVAKKKNREGVVEKVKATHSFDIDDELSYNVSIKITEDKQGSGGLSVDVEGPMKHTTVYTDYQISTIRTKMKTCGDILYNHSMRLPTKALSNDTNTMINPYEVTYRDEARMHPD